MKNEIKMNFKWLIFAGIEATTLFGSPVRLGAWNTYLPKEGQNKRKISIYIPIRSYYCYLIFEKYIKGTGTHSHSWYKSKLSKPSPICPKFPDNYSSLVQQHIQRQDTGYNIHLPTHDISPKDSKNMIIDFSKTASLCLSLWNEPTSSLSTPKQLKFTKPNQQLEANLYTYGITRPSRYKSNLTIVPHLLHNRYS